MHTTRPLGTGRPRVTHSAAIRLGLGRAGQVHAAVSPDNRTLTIARGHGVVTVDTHGLEVIGRTKVPGPVSGLGWSDDGKRLYVLTPDSVRLVDPATGRQLRRIDSAGIRGIDYVGSLDEESR
jgi:DNA-binding beta-propeller fold protein YncE